MPKAAKTFADGNRLILKGEEFQIPDGEETAFREGGYIAGDDTAPPAAPGAAPGGAASPAAEEEPIETADAPRQRGKR